MRPLIVLKTGEKGKSVVAVGHWPFVDGWHASARCNFSKLRTGSALTLVRPDWQLWNGPRRKLNV